MKKLNKILSLTLALVMVFTTATFASAAPANVAEESGGSASSAVTLFSTDDGTTDGNPAATAMSVTVPTVLPIAVGTDGQVTTATNCEIINNSYGAVKVSSATIQAQGGWKLADYTTNMANQKVDSNQIGFALAIGGGAEQMTDNSSTTSQALLSDAITGCYMTGEGDTTGNKVSVDYDAVVSPVSEAVTNAGVASVVFVISWDI